MDKIKKTLTYLNKAFDESLYLNEHLENKKYRYEHTLRVANIGKAIAFKERFDVEAMVVACLLHDISYCEEFKSESDWRNHGRKSVRIARSFVESLGFDKETENDILYGIAIHVDDEADFDGVRTPFALCIGDADNIDRFDTYRIFETLKNDKFDALTYDEQVNICQNRIARLNTNLTVQFSTKTTTEMFHDKVSFQLEFYSRLISQLENSIIIK